MYRVLIVLLLLLVAWGVWAVFQVGSAWKQERKAEPEPVPQGAPAPIEPPTPEAPVPEPEPPDLAEANKLELLDQRVRECISQQQGVALPLKLERMMDISGHEYGPVSVIRLEPDGIHIRHENGVTKVGFAWLSGEMKERFFLEDDLAVRYRAVNAERKRAAEQARLRKQKQAASTVAAAPAPEPDRTAGGYASGGASVCGVCGAKGKKLMRVWRPIPGKATFGHVMCCPRCIPSTNGADPYMER